MTPIQKAIQEYQTALIEKLDAEDFMELSISALIQEHNLVDEDGNPATCLNDLDDNEEEYVKALNLIRDNIDESYASDRKQKAADALKESEQKMFELVIPMMPEDDAATLKRAMNGSYVQRQKLISLIIRNYAGGN